MWECETDKSINKSAHRFLGAGVQDGGVEAREGRSLGDDAQHRPGVRLHVPGDEMLVGGRRADAMRSDTIGQSMAMPDA